MRGVFITLEGVEGAGKTTQAQLLKARLDGLGYPVVVTREPGGARIAEAIRALLLDSNNTDISPMTELLLYEAARAQHVDEVIRPALESGAVVISDRFADSTTAYQGAGRAIPSDVVHRLHRIATRGVWPDLTILLDVPIAEGLARAGRSGLRDRMEREPDVFHERVRQEFLRLAAEEPERVKVVDGSRAPDVVSEDVFRRVEPVLPACRS